MTDDELDDALWQASFGEVFPAKIAMLEIASRLIHSRRLTMKSVELLARRLIEEVENSSNTNLLFPQARRKGAGRPPSVGKLTRLGEVMMLAKVRAEGFADLSPDRASTSNSISSFEETARRLGYTGAKAEKVAARIRQADRLLSKPHKPEGASNSQINAVIRKEK